MAEIKFLKYISDAPKEFLGILFSVGDFGVGAQHGIIINFEK